MSNNGLWYLDLAGVVAYAGAASFGLFLGGPDIARIVLAAPLLLFIPGYAIVCALFPDTATNESNSFDDQKTGLRNPLTTGPGIGPIERFVLSVILSIGTVSTMALLSTVTPWGVRLRPILAGITLVTIVLSIIAIVARARCSPDIRYSPSIPTPLLFSNRGRGAYETTNTRLFNAALICSVVILLASGGYAIGNPPQHDGFTEVSVETENVTGETDVIYQSTFERGQPHDLPITIDNQEHRDVTYTTVVLLQRVEYADDNETATVLEEDELTRTAVTVADGDSHTEPLEITPTMAGDDLRLAILVYDGDAPGEPSVENAYRVLDLPIEVV